MHSLRVFRLFLSSTFSDFIAEREALQRNVFPELERYCAQRGARFQAVDLRWGITEEAQREHDTMRICLEEVRRCQQLSPRPNFAVLLGDRYGWEPVPARIPIDHWQRLLLSASDKERELIEKSYRLDQNAVPPVYCLKDTDPVHNVAAFQQEADLLQALRSAARNFRGSARLPYFASATHQEIALGALQRADDKRRPLHPEQHVHVYVRHLDGLPQAETARDFIDWDAGRGRPIPGARQRLRGLERQLRQRLGNNVHDLHTSWERHGRDGAEDKAYLAFFCDEFLRHQKALIDAELDAFAESDERVQREQAHGEFGYQRARVFAGRKELVAMLGRYTAPPPVGKAKRSARNSGPGKPLILLGGGGSGKSALLARAAANEKASARQSGALVVQRYIGGVPGTQSLMTMLAALTDDIASAYGRPGPPTPDNAKALAENFRLALSLASAGRPLVIFLDALDQLDGTDSAWLLDWLPADLPEHVRLIASARTGSVVEQSARRRYPGALIDMPPMSRADGKAMLGAWLADSRAAWFNAGIAPPSGRCLTSEQEQAVLSAFAANGSPLWLKLAFEQVSAWKSWDAPSLLPSTVQGLIADLVEKRLIRTEKHPRIFTERALAYLTAGRFGLSESELGRALGTDPAVRAEFEADQRTQRSWDDQRSLPPVLWSRLFFDLQPYMSLASVDGALLMGWFHREFGDVIAARYLGDADRRREIHGRLADCVTSLERELRPQETNDDALFKATDASGKQVSAALRRVMEQPWQLAKAGRYDELEALLADFGFCMGKCAANRIDDFVADISAHSHASAQTRLWVSYIRAWRQRLRMGDRRWPAHRILIQLAGESVDFAARLDNAAYEELVENTYFSNQTLKVENLNIRRISNAGILKNDSSCEFLFYNNRWLLIIRPTGIATMIDVQLDMVVGDDLIVERSISDEEKAKIFMIEPALVECAHDISEADQAAGFEFDAKFPGVIKIHHSEIVLGNGPVSCLGRFDNEIIFLCEEQIFLVNPVQLSDQTMRPGSFSAEGARIEMLEGMQWDYSRFGICVFLDENTLLSLGWEGSHSQRDEIRGEIWNVNSASTTRKCELLFNDGLDFPLGALGILQDGRVVFTGENFRRSYVVDPKNYERHLEHLWPMEWSWFNPREADRWHLSSHSTASAWLWPERLQSEAVQTLGRFTGQKWSNNFYWVRISNKNPMYTSGETITFEEYPLIRCAEYLDEGTFLLWDNMEEIEDAQGSSALTIGEGSQEQARWFSDVPMICAAKVRSEDIVVIKRSGPVTIRRGVRSQSGNS